MTSEPLNDGEPLLSGSPHTDDDDPSSDDLPKAVRFFADVLDTRAGRFIKFAVVGGSGVIVNLVVFQAVFSLFGYLDFLESSWRHTVANGVGVVVSIFTNFLLNDSWTWGDRAKGDRRDWVVRLARYYMTCSVAAVAQIGGAALSYMHLFRPMDLSIFGWNPTPSLAVLVGIICGIAINFPISHIWAFKDVDVSHD